ncbi:MAG: cadherin-like domain-containing protein, partial [Bacteroidetes bacterium]|nr:cadherin-like domain-containing protein [Bacteroidota bacterium]
MMKKVTIASFLFSSFSFFAQQIGNSDMEAWDNVGAATEEPTNWNSFKSGQGSFTSFASKQVERSTAIRTGATGQYCARVWAKSTLGIVANGNMTVGRINMGSSTPSDPNNYNISLTADANFSEALTASPDSLVFWVKYTAANAIDSARVHAVLHDAYDLRDPIDANSSSHVVARAERNYLRTSGSWVRISVPFVYNGPATNPAFLLVTFTTNKTPGGGTANDEVLVDDIQLIYNPTSSNQQMTANDDASSTNQNTAVTINVLANDTDPENNISVSTVTIVQQAQNGIATANMDGTVTYTPNTGFFGGDNFNYQVCDGDSPATCDQANVTLV